jgi:hypothetical protein
MKLHHLHIDRWFGQEDLDVVLPMRRLGAWHGAETWTSQTADSSRSLQDVFRSLRP